MPGESAKERWLVPPTPPYQDRPAMSDRVRRAIRQEERTCLNKEVHWSLAYAKLQAAKLNTALGWVMPLVEAYPCRYGRPPHYHVGHPDREE
jgi:hypothetical protein